MKTLLRKSINLRELKQRRMSLNAERKGQRQRNDEIAEVLREQQGVILVYDEKFV